MASVNPPGIGICVVCVGVETMRVRGVLCFVFACACAGAIPTGLPSRRLWQVEPDVMWATKSKVGVLSRFMKRVYADISLSDTKSLAKRFYPEFEELCERYGVDDVTYELTMLHRMHVNDLEITLDHMRKIGFLLQVMFRVEESSAG
jgi:hypothetical protein